MAERPRHLAGEHLLERASIREARELVLESELARAHQLRSHAGALVLELVALDGGQGESRLVGQGAGELHFRGGPDSGLTHVLQTDDADHPSVPSDRGVHHRRDPERHEIRRGELARTRILEGVVAVDGPAELERLEVAGEILRLEHWPFGMATAAPLVEHVAPELRALVVEQHLTNLSNRPLSFQCVLFAPDRRRETRQIIDLGRERTTLTFVLPDGEQLIGKKLWLRAEEIGGSRVLNYTLTAER